MPLTDAEFAAILDGSKLINGDIHWDIVDKKGKILKFRRMVECDSAEILFLDGFHNREYPTLSYSLFTKEPGRIYGLDMAVDVHGNPDGSLVGPVHKHRWSNRYKAKQAYSPSDITAPASDPLAVWNQFCEEARIQHNGVMHLPSPPELQSQRRNRYG